MDLEAFETGVRVTKEVFEAESANLRVDLLNAQFDLRGASWSLLILLTGTDRIGIEETYDRLHEWLDARYIDADPCLPPTEEDRERPYLWRFARALPMDGRTGLFLHAWVQDTIVGRLTGELGGEHLVRRIDEIRELERTLVADGNVLLKLWLHVPRKELKKRLKRARKDPDQEWRVSEQDRQVFEHYEDVLPVAERFLEETGSSDAPWILVDSVDARHRDLVVGRAVRDALTAGLGRDGGGAAAPVVRVPRRATSVLDGVDLTRSLGEKEYDERLEELQARLRRLALRARRKGQSSVLAFEGWDAGGKGGSIRRLTNAMDARDYKVVPTAAPTEEERRHHYLWRFWRQLPRAGRMLILDRSWYGRVLVERVEGYATDAEWGRAYDEIRAFERTLVDAGLVLLKFWLHIDPDEQLRRFQAREKTPYKKYKLTADDYRNRERWDDYVAAVDEMVERTSTERAPWHLIAANDKRWARVQVLEKVCAALGEAL